MNSYNGFSRHSDIDVFYLEQMLLKFIAFQILSEVKNKYGFYYFIFSKSTSMDQKLRNHVDKQVFDLSAEIVLE